MLFDLDHQQVSTNSYNSRGLTSGDFRKIKYRFFVPDTTDYTKPFYLQSDRRLIKISLNTNCAINLSDKVSYRRGQKSRAVMIVGTNRFNIEWCVHQIQETFPRFFALAPLDKSLSELRQPELSDVRQYYTTENLLAGDITKITYYKLQFYVLDNCYTDFNWWKKSPAAKAIEKMNCHLVISLKNHPDAGYVRRYAVILGRKRTCVIRAYKLFYSTFLSKYW